MKEKGRHFYYFIIFSLVILVLFLNFIPIWQIVVNAFKLIDDYNGAGKFTGVNVFMLPRQWTLSSFVYFFQISDALRAFLNTIVLSVCCVIILEVLGAITALILAQYRVWFTDHVVKFLIAAQAIPVVMTMITTFRITRGLHWLDTYQGAIIALSAQFLPFTIFLFYSYYLSLPRDLFDAAEIDGASFPQVFFKIVLPMSTTILATIGILIFIFTWGTYLIGLVILREQEMQILSQVIQNMDVALRLKRPVYFAAFAVFSVPMMAMAWWMQFYISAGMLSGALKE